MRLSQAGAHLIEASEGFSARPYRDPVGIPTIGFGSTKGVTMSSPPITRAQAQARMMREVDQTYGAAVNQLGLPLNQYQFDALVSFVYNVGPGGVAATTGVGRALRRHDWQAAANAMLPWNKGTMGGRLVVLPGLTTRRRAERALFLRTPRTDPLEGYRADEKRWIREFDALKRRQDARTAQRRRVLVKVMTKRRKEIYRAAKATGLDRGKRRERYRSLLARTKPAG